MKRIGTVCCWLGVVLTWCDIADLSDVAAQQLAPQTAVERMQLAEGMRVDIVAAEPLVRQPVAIEFDDRGRLWVIQYLQYPNPNGLSRVSVDRYSRTQYDRVPAPPPQGPRGADRITLLTDNDGDGRMDQGRDVVTGLNLATGLAFGHGGMFVLNVPYLLFYPDRNRDDQPDSDPEVLLTGFGMEDAHSVANSLTWGPDGWLYGCQGSTVTARVRGIEFQQGVWRYHPVTQQFELFCEGGGNAWGLDFDSTGRLFYSTNYGGYVLVHGVQGGYYVKSFGKHGALHNPHAYGYFEHAPHHNFVGGHVTVGGLIYQADLLPQLQGRYLAGDLLGHGVYWHEMMPWGSTVKTSHGGELLVANDPWFAPTDLTVGPDGAIYVADWHDARTAHPDPDADWDRSNGRIYRIAPPQSLNASQSYDFAGYTLRELLERQRDPNQWHVRRARQELTRRWHELGKTDPATRDREFVATQRELTKLLFSNVNEQTTLEALWSLNAIESCDAGVLEQCLDSPYAAVRAWSIRLLGDRRVLTAELAERLDALAELETDITVRQQLACSAARFAPQHAMPIINANINRDLPSDRDDPFLPLLWWWAVETHAINGCDEVLDRFTRRSLWNSQLGRDTLLPKLTRRYAADPSPLGLAAVLRLLDAAPDQAARLPLWQAVLLGWTTTRMDAVNGPMGQDTEERLRQLHDLSRRVIADWQKSPVNPALWQLAILMRHPPAIEAAKQTAFDGRSAAAQRATALTLLTHSFDHDLIDPTLRVLNSTLVDTEEQTASEQIGRDTLQHAALELLSQYNEPRIALELMRIHQASHDPALRSRIRDLLLSRAEWAEPWLMAVDRGEILAEITSLEQVRRVNLLGSPRLDEIVAKHWGKLVGQTREERLAEVRRLNNDLRAGEGSVEAGQRLFQAHCAKCHRLFGEGNRVGPDLTSANRQDREFLLLSLVDPSSVIRKEYVSAIVQTASGRVVTGMPVARTQDTLVLVDSKGDRQTISTSDVEELQDSPLSLMPDDLFRQFKPQELRDLFAYLQKKE